MLTAGSACRLSVLHGEHASTRLASHRLNPRRT
jgi:hypothetical protein